MNSAQSRDYKMLKREDYLLRQARSVLYLKKIHTENRTMKSVVLILALAIPSFSYAGQNQLADYVVRTAKFEELIPGTTNKLQWVKKCVFHPIFRGRVQSSRLYDQQTAQATATTLNNLDQNHVYLKDGRRLEVKYGKFGVSADSYPRFYADSDIPPQGCGDILVTSNSSIVSSMLPKNSELLLQLLEDKEQELFVTALRSKHAKLIPHQRQSLAKHDLRDTYSRTRKSEISVFHDGEEWYLVRSYGLDRNVNPGIPTSVNALILYKYEQDKGRLTPRLAFLSTGSDERWIRLEHFGALDIDGDNMNEMIVKVFLYEGSYYSYVRKKNGRWSFE